MKNEEIKITGTEITADDSNLEKRTPQYLQKMKERGEKIVMVCPASLPPFFTELCEEAGVDIIRYSGFGKDIISRGESMYWMTERLRATAPVIHLNAYLENQQMAGKYMAIENARKIIGLGADSVVTTGMHNETVRLLTDCGLPVLTHVGGYTGWVSQMVFRRIGETAEQAMAIYKIAYEYQESGAIGLTLEGTPRELSRKISESLRIPVIGLGASHECDGTELLANDLLGLKKESSRGLHAKIYANLREETLSAFSRFVKEVRGCEYPDESHMDRMDRSEFERFEEKLADLK